MHSPDRGDWWEAKYKREVLGIIPKETIYSVSCLLTVSQLNKIASKALNKRIRKMLK